MPDHRIFSLMKKGDMRHHILLLYSVVRGLGAKTIFEIGVRKGISSLALAMGAAETGGRVHALDIKECPEAINLIYAFGLQSHWEFLQGDSRSYWKIWRNPIDVLFIDGDHQLPAVKSDFENFSKFVRKNGLILMHDGWCDEVKRAKYNVEVHQYLPEIKKMADQFEMVTLPYGNGMTIIRKLR